MSGDWLLVDELAPQTAGDLLEPLYRAAAQGRLALPCCTGCGLPLELEQRVCDGCGGCDIGWPEVALRGTVHSATLMHRLEPGLVRASAPYPLLDVETDSGHRLIMTTTHPRHSAPGIGDRVAIGFRRLGGVSVPAALSTVPTETEEP